MTIKEAEALDQNGQIPIQVEVSERKFRYYGVGATVSSTEGLGMEGYWGHRNLFGRAEKLRIDGAIRPNRRCDEPGRPELQRRR